NWRSRRSWWGSHLLASDWPRIVRPSLEHAPWCDGRGRGYLCQPGSSVNHSSNPRKMPATILPARWVPWRTGPPRPSEANISSSPDRSFMPDRPRAWLLILTLVVIAGLILAHPTLALDQQSFTLVGRGRNLAMLGDCNACHRDPKNGQPFA